MKKHQVHIKTASTINNDKLIRNIISQFLILQDQENWLDENFKKKIGGIPEERFFERPIPELHSIAELISHILEWRIECIRRIKNIDIGFTVDSPENWRTNDALKEIGWPKLKNDFYQSVYDLIEVLADKDDTFLENRCRNDYTFRDLIEGIIHHDLYHLGQLGITVKFLNLKSNPN